LSGIEVTDSLTNLAVQTGLDTTQFSSCLNSHKYKAQVDADQAAGTVVGVSGTPTFFVDGIRMVGAQPFSAFQKIIDQELKK
jgi:protein-disulfide isomerase